MDQIGIDKTAQKVFPFKRAQRLLVATDYKNVFDHNDFRASHKNALIIARSNKTKGARLGLIISKKNVRRAVDRNRLKRVVREGFRLHASNIAGLDIVVMARSGLGNLDNKIFATLVVSLIENIAQQRLVKNDSVAN